MPCEVGVTKEKHPVCGETYRVTWVTSSKVGWEIINYHNTIAANGRKKQLSWSWRPYVIDQCNLESIKIDSRIELHN